MVLVLGLEVKMNLIGFENEGTLGYSIWSFDGMNYEKTCGFIARKYLEQKDGC